MDNLEKVKSLKWVIRSIEEDCENNCIENKDKFDELYAIIDEVLSEYEK